MGALIITAIVLVLTVVICTFGVYTDSVKQNKPEPPDPTIERFLALEERISEIERKLDNGRIQPVENEMEEKK